MKSVRSFFDTNVLVYTDDQSAPGKHEKAVELIKEARRQGTGVLSTQVLQEYFAATTRKMGVPAEVARSKIEFFSRLDVVLIDVPLVLGAIDFHRLHRVSIWDALIVQAATQAQCRRLYSEDMQHERRIGSLTILNPFL